MKNMKPTFAIGQLHRCQLHPRQIKVIDAAKGTVEYIASDESIDSCQEVIAASGWQFNRFQKNAPFVDSHNYSSIDCLLGSVVDYRVENQQLVETVQWAIDVPTNFLAIKGFQMTQAGYLKAVSVGFIPLEYVGKWDTTGTWDEVMDDLGMGALEDSIRCVYTRQEQFELSACCIGANGNAVARSFKAGILSDADLEKISALQARREIAPVSDVVADDAVARLRQRTAFLLEMQLNIAKSL
jgi:hypothetical protein